MLFAYKDNNPKPVFASNDIYHMTSQFTVDMEW